MDPSASGLQTGSAVAEKTVPLAPKHRSPFGSTGRRRRGNTLRLERRTHYGCSEQQNRGVKIVYALALVAIMIIAISLRVWRLGSVPRPLADEVVAAVSLHSLFNSSSGGLLSIVTPVLDGRAIVKAFGGTRLVDLRMISVLFGLGTVLVIVDLANRLYGRGAALVAGCAVAIMPWAVYYSRIFFPAAEYMFVSLLVVYTAIAVLHRESTWWLLVCCTMIAVTIYIYPASIVSTPLVLVVVVMSYDRAAKRLPLSTWLWGALLTSVLLMPYIWAHLINIGTGTATINGVIGSRQLFRSGLPLGAEVTQFARSYASYFTPSYLLFHGDPNPGQSIQTIGEVGPILTVMGLVGLLVSIKRIREHQYRLVVLLLLVFPVADALTLQNSIGNSDVAVLGVIPWALLAGVGGIEIAQWAGSISKRLAGGSRHHSGSVGPSGAAAQVGHGLPIAQLVSLSIAGLLTIAQVVQFAPRYFGPYNQTYPSYFEMGFARVGDVLKRAGLRTDGLPVTIDAGYQRALMYSYFLHYRIRIASVYQSCQPLPRDVLLYSVPEQIIVIREGRDYGADRGCVNQLTLISREIAAFKHYSKHFHIRVLKIFQNDPKQLSGPRYETAVLLLLLNKNT